MAAIVNAFPEVAHNYERRHALNMWFVLAVERPEQIEAAVARIEAAAGLRGAEPAQARRVLPRAEAHRMMRRDRPPPRRRDASGACRSSRGPTMLSPSELGLAPEEVMRRLRRMLASGVIRRIGAVPNHYRLGWTENGMSVWDVEEARLRELGPKVGALPFVTHCYRRPRRPPLWPYNLFAMVHGRAPAEVSGKGRGDRGVFWAAPAAATTVLSSTRILKKTGLGSRAEERKHHVPAQPVHARARPNPRPSSGARRPARW